MQVIRQGFERLTLPAQCTLLTSLATTLALAGAWLWGEFSLQALAWEWQQNLTARTYALCPMATMPDSSGP